MSTPQTTAPTVVDVQSQSPPLALSLSRVGVTGVEKVIRLRDNGSENLFSGRFECVKEGRSEQKGAHRAWFEEIDTEAIGEVVLGDRPFRVEALDELIAQLVSDRQGAQRAE